MSLPPPLLSPTAAALRADERRASLSLLVSASLFAIMALLARSVSARIPGPQIALVRFATGVVVVLIAWRALRLDLRPQRWRWLIVRGVCGGIAVLLYFTCIARVGVGVATLLNYTAPVWTLMFSWAFLDEPPRRAQLAALGLTLAGVVLVIGVDPHTFRANAWQLAGVASSVMSGLATTSIRAVRRASPGGGGHESSWTVFASFTSVGVLATLPGVVGPWGTWVAPGGREWALLFAVAGFSIAAQLVMTRALRHVTGMGMGIIHQLTVVITMAGGLLLFGETLTARGFVGSLLTIAGVIGLLLFG